jgi:hypothetical protein
VIARPLSGKAGTIPSTPHYNSPASGSLSQPRMSGYDNAIGGKLKLKGKALTVDPTLKKKKKKKTKPPPPGQSSVAVTDGGAHSQH